MSPVRVIAPAFRALSIIGFTALLALALAACGGGAGGSPTPGPTIDAEATPGTPLAETASDNKFATTNYTLVAGQAYTLTLTNAGKAVHNWHILGQNGPDGKPLTTPLIEGGKSSTVTFTLTKPGAYHFQCDVHPTEMTGTLVVN